VIAQPARMDGLGNERVPERVHGQKRRHARHVAVVVHETGPGHLGAGRRLDRGMMVICAPLIMSCAKGKARPAKIAAAACAADDDVGQLLPRLLELGLASRPIMVWCRSTVVEHAAERVAGLARAVGHRSLDGLADAIPRLPGVSGMLAKDGRPALVRLLGLAMQFAPHTCIISLRNGFCSKLMRTMKTLHSKPMRLHAKAVRCPTARRQSRWSAA